MGSGPAAADSVDSSHPIEPSSAAGLMLYTRAISAEFLVPHSHTPCSRDRLRMNVPRHRHCLWLACAVAVWLVPAAAFSLEHVSVVLKPGARPKNLSGKAIIQARDGGMLLRTADGG